jgi:hypothetical protein
MRIRSVLALVLALWLAPSFGQAARPVVPSKQDLSQLNLKDLGPGSRRKTPLVQLDMRKKFSQKYLKQLKSKVLEATEDGSLILFNHPDDNGGGRLRNYQLKLDPKLKELLKPMVEFANNAAEQISQGMPRESERGNMEIDVLRLAVSGREKRRQLDTNLHIDSRRYLTAVVNLGGAGTEVFPNGGKAEGFQTELGFLNVFNGGKRTERFRNAPGTGSLLHKATLGSRLSLIMFMQPRRDEN